MIRIVITEASIGMADGIRQQLASGGDFEIVGYARDGLEAAQLAIQLAPDVLMVHEDLPEVSGYRVSELVNAAASDVGVLVLVEQETPEALRRGMAAGARAVLPLDAPTDRLVALVAEVASLKGIRDEPEFPLVTDPERMPVSTAITSARGGAGKTTVAVNLAVLFAQRFPNQVALVDFHGQFGDACVALDIAPNDSIADLASFPELDAELVQTHLMTHAPTSLRLLAAPEVPLDDDADIARIDTGFMASLIGHLRRSYRFVFFDIPPLLWPLSEYVFSRCQQIIVVTNLFDLAAIRNCRSLLMLAEDAVGDAERVKLVANRSPRRGDFGLNDLEQTTGRKVYCQLPDDFETATGALNGGLPVVTEYPNSPLGKALSGLADQLQREFHSKANNA